MKSGTQVARWLGLVVLVLGQVAQAADSTKARSGAVAVPAKTARTNATAAVSGKSTAPKGAPQAASSGAVSRKKPAVHAVKAPPAEDAAPTSPGTTVRAPAVRPKYTLTTLTTAGNLSCRLPGEKSLRPAGSGVLEAYSGISLKTAGRAADIQLPGGSFLSMDSNTLIQVGLYENGIFVVQRKGRLWHRVKKGADPEWFYTVQAPAMRVTATASEFGTAVQLAKGVSDLVTCQVETGKVAATLPSPLLASERGRSNLESRVFSVPRCPMPPEAPATERAAVVRPDEGGLTAAQKAERAVRRVLDTWGRLPKDGIREILAGRWAVSDARYFLVKATNSPDGPVPEVLPRKQTGEGAMEFPIRLVTNSVPRADAWVGRNRFLSANLRDLDRLVARKQITESEFRSRLFSLLHPAEEPRAAVQTASKAPPALDLEAAKRLVAALKANARARKAADEMYPGFVEIFEGIIQRTEATGRLSREDQAHVDKLNRVLGMAPPAPAAGTAPPKSGPSAR